MLDSESPAFSRWDVDLCAPGGPTPDCPFFFVFQPGISEIQISTQVGFALGFSVWTRCLPVPPFPLSSIHRPSLPLFSCHFFHNRHRMASSPSGPRPPPPPLRASAVHLTSHEINILIHCYLQESNLQHSAFTFAQESKLAQTTPDDLVGAKVQRGELLRWLHKGLCWSEVETHVSEVREGLALSDSWGAA